MYFTSQPTRRISLFIFILFLYSSFHSRFSAQGDVEASIWDELLALDEERTKLIFSMNEDCTSCFEMFTYLDYLNLHKRDDVEMYVLISKPKSSTAIVETMKSEFKTYGYAFPYYFIDDGDYEREEFNANPRTYIVNHKKVASDAYYKISDENKTAILDLVTEEAKKSIAEVDKLYTTEWRTIKPKGVDGDKTYYLVHEKKWRMGARERTNSIGMHVNKGDILWVESEGGIYLDVGVGYAFSDPQGLSDEAYAEFKPVKDHNYGTLLVLIFDPFTRKPVQAMACIDKGIKINVEQSGYIMLRTNQNDSLKNRGGEFKGVIKRFVLNE